jgi:magnesium chelatase subunit D
VADADAPPLTGALNPAAYAAAMLLAVDPLALGGAVLHAPASPVRDAWLALVRAHLPPEVAWRRVPHHADRDALLGGLDVAATLQSGRRAQRHGLLQANTPQLLLCPMAERMPRDRAAWLGATLDDRAPTALLLLDEHHDDEPEQQVAHALGDRLALHVTLHGVAQDAPAWTATDVQRARRTWTKVHVEDAVRHDACALATALGVPSLRAPLQLLRVARMVAALQGQPAVDQATLTLAMVWVLAPRATQLPEAAAEPSAQAAEQPPNQQTNPDTNTNNEQPQAGTPDALPPQVLEAARAAIPPGLLALLERGLLRHAGQGSARQPPSGGTSGRGRPVGARRGTPHAKARLHVLDTLRAAAPWQTLRRREAGDAARGLHVVRDDLRVWRHKPRGQTTTVFVVDASGSAALHRLAEAKGAVELLLAECYVRRDRVALLAFGGASAQTLLPPTRALARAKRSLAALPGGGGTPLANAIEQAQAMAATIRREQQRPMVVMLTDGRANVARDGSPGREQASADALAAARAFATSGVAALWLDTSIRPQADAAQLAAAMGARYLPMPHATAERMAQAVQHASG